MSDLENEIIQDEFRSSFFLTTKYLCNFSNITKNSHIEVIEALESNDKQVMIVMPRGHFKSSIASCAYPIWSLLNDPNKRIMIASETFINAKNFIRQIKGVYSSPLFMETFGDVRAKGDWTSSTLTVSSRTNFNHKESSITASSLGVIRVGQHYDEIILDDLNSEDNSDTPEKCLAVIDYYKRLTSILEPGGRMIIVATRYSENDVIGHILREELDKYDPLREVS